MTYSTELQYGSEGIVVCCKNQLTGFHMIDRLDIRNFTIKTDNKNIHTGAPLTFPLVHDNMLNAHVILSSRIKKTARHGFETISYRSPFLWINLTQDAKSQTFFSISNKIRESKTEISTHRLCKHYQVNQRICRCYFKKLSNLLKNLARLLLLIQLVFFGNL